VSAVPLSRDEIQARLLQSPFIAFLQLEVISADPERGEIVVRAPLRPEFERVRGSGQWHGGPIASVIDTVGDYALVMLLGRGLPTINFRVVTARVRRQGRMVGVVDVDVANEAGALVAVGRACYATAQG
jgi:acyl-coenzyme A thioesterase PaaI-like protein